MTIKQKISSVILCVMAVYLSGCAVVAIGAIGAAAAGTAAVVASDPRNSGTVLDDNGINIKLAHRYAKYKNANIYINTYNGSVLLTGQVPDLATKNDADFQAKTIPGVRKLYDYLEIRLPQSITAISTDSMITTQAKTKLLTMKNIKSNAIKIITTNQIVYVFGIVTQDQAQDIASTIANIGGVRKVVTLFEYVMSN